MDCKPMASIGAGVRALRVRGASGALRMIYVGRFAVAVHVLHCLEKKTQKTRVRDSSLAKRRIEALATPQ